MQEIIEQLQKDLNKKLAGADMYRIDSYSYNCLLIAVVSSINKSIITLNLSTRDIVSKLNKEYILFQTKNSIPLFEGKLTVLIEFNSHFVSNIEVSIIY